MFDATQSTTSYSTPTPPPPPTPHPHCHDMKTFQFSRQAIEAVPFKLYMINICDCGKCLAAIKNNGYSKGLTCSIESFG